MPTDNLRDQSDSAGSNSYMAPDASSLLLPGGQEGETKHRSFRRALKRAAVFAAMIIVLGLALAGWLAHKAIVISDNLSAANNLMPEIRKELVSKDPSAAREKFDRLRSLVQSAKDSATDPVWTVGRSLPFIGPNFAAVSEVALSVNDVVMTAGEPLLHVSTSIGWDALTPTDGRFKLEPLAMASPSVVTAANAVELTYARLKSIDQSQLLPEVRRPLSEATATLDEVRGGLSVAADTSRILPSMLGRSGMRNYLVLVQNSAEVRATGGLPGALAILRVEDGAVSLAAQSSGSAMGKFTPAVPVAAEETQIYTERLGSYISDVNLTPNFPTAALSAKSMWEQRHGTTVDGVIAIDAVVLSHILDATGPMDVPASMMDPGLPPTLTGKNVVKTLLSDAYLSLPTNDVQDAYFAAVSEEVFRRVTSGSVPGAKLVAALGKSATENRLFVWSAHKYEQEVLASTAMGGSISGPNSGGASFGVYFNDGTGAKMDYYVRRKINLVTTCQLDGTKSVKVRVTLTNTAPADAARSLPVSVTGGGIHGTAPGRVATNVIAYGPAQARIEGATQNGTDSAVGSFIHKERPVGVLRTNLAPGQSSTVEFAFSKIVQNADPTVRVSPTTEDPAEVIDLSESDDICNAE